MGLDYHIEIDGSWYSVPYRLIREQVDVRASERTVEIFQNGKRLAGHARSPGHPGHTTIPEHMPSSHRRHAEWTPARLMASARKIGPAAEAPISSIMAARPHPEQGFRSCTSRARLEAACQRAGQIKARSASSVRSILQPGLDRGFLEAEPDHKPCATATSAAATTSTDPQSRSPHARPSRP